MKYLLLLVFSLLTQLAFTQGKSQIVIGESFEIDSDILGEQRQINIYLPLDFDEDRKQTYSVIYLLDGGLDEDFVHLSGIVQFLSFPWIATLPPSILVGIENVDRKRDFTFPTTIPIDKKDFPTSGGSKKFIDFLKLELQPFIQNEYRGSETQTIVGQSLGGLLATEVLFTQPDLFDNYVIVSPSLWWDQQSLLKMKTPSSVQEKALFIAVGKEGDIMEDDAESLYEKVNMHENVYFQFFEAQNHGDVLHLAVYEAFERIFKEKINVK
jgi:predicted alpha/beta superfamily hydrolase